MNIRQWVLSKIAEECAEIAQRANKSSLFGDSEIQSGQEFTNAKRLAEEVKDLLVVLELARKHGIFIETDCEGYRFAANLRDWEINQRAEKLNKYLRYSQDLGNVQLPSAEAIRRSDENYRKECAEDEAEEEVQKSGTLRAEDLLEQDRDLHGT